MKKLRLNNLFYSDKKSYHLVENKVYHPQSLASYILLKKHYCQIQTQNVSKSRRVWLTFRNRLLKKMRKKKGQLDCYYCGLKNLTANFNNPKIELYGGKATLDHYNALANKGKRFDESNLVCSCSKCNNMKGCLSPEEFYQKIKNQKRFKGEFVFKMKTLSSLENLQERKYHEGHELASA